MNNDHKRTVREDLADFAGLVAIFLMCIYGIPLLAAIAS